MDSHSDSNALSRDSIYVKFDPLVNKVSLKASDACAHIVNEVPDKRLCEYSAYGYTYGDLDSSCRDLLGLDTPPRSVKKLQPVQSEDYYVASGFSPVAEAVPTNSQVRVVI